MAGSDGLFVYGTLRRGFRLPMSNWLARNAEFVGVASLPGQLYDAGDYPALCLTADNRAPVIGDLYRLPRPRTTLRKLDRYEGIGPGWRRPYEYRRERVSVTLPDGSRREAWVYVYARPVKGLRRIAEGDYLRWCRK